MGSSLAVFLPFFFCVYFIFFFEIDFDKVKNLFYVDIIFAAVADAVNIFLYEQIPLIIKTIIVFLFFGAYTRQKQRKKFCGGVAQLVKVPSH